MNTYFILISIIIIIIIYCINQYTNFNNINLNLDENFYSAKSNDNNNVFIKKIPNIFYTPQFLDNLYKPPNPPKKSIQDIDLNSYIDSNIISTKIICASITDQARCWDNNNCQWVEKVGKKSFCTTAPKFLL